MPVLAPMHKDNVLVLTAYLNQGNVVVAYKGKVRTAHFSDNNLKKMMKGGDVERKKRAIEKFLPAMAQLILLLTEDGMIETNIINKETQHGTQEKGRG